MNYYADGQVGGPVRFEIDNTALHLWSLAVQAASLAPADRAALLDKTWPSAKVAAQVIRDWKAKTGLQAPASPTTVAS